MAAHGDKVYVAWHSTNELQHAVLADGAEFQTTRLEGYDDWIKGMDVTDDGKLVIAGWIDEGFFLFDVNTGAALGNIPATASTSLLGGIECVSGGTAE